MCGIFGVLAGSGTALTSGQTRLLAKALLLHSQQRGRDASGIAALTAEGGLAVVKQPTSPARLLRLPAYDKLIRDAIGRLPICLIGHARMATSGSWQDDRNNQPLQRDGIALIHNGVLANPEELWQRHPDPASRQAEVDTEALLALLAHDRIGGRHTVGGLASAARRVFGQLEGSASVAAICAEERQLLLASNTGSLFVLRGHGCVVFASERYFLDSVRNDPRFSGIGLGVPQQMKPGSGLLIDIDTLQETGLELPYGTEPFPVRRFAFDAGRAATAIRDWGFVQYDEAALGRQRRCTRCILPESYPHIDFDADGVCNYCRHMKPTVVKGQTKQTLATLIEGYARQARQKGRDTYCILPLSGGRDSCYGTHMLVREFGLKPLTYTYDWGMVTDLARRNIARVCGRLGLENILVSADITRKLDYIRSNVSAWLKQPDLGLIPLFMAGDKHFFSWVNRIKEQNGIDLNIWMMSPLENADFKEGFAGVAPHWERERTDYLSPSAKLKLLAYYGFAFLRNPRYLNRSIPDTATGFLSFYVEPRRDYYNLFDFVPWNEDEVNSTIFDAFGWENASDSPNTWRIGDGTAPFYNYIYCTVAGFTENDTFRSNQIRNGDISRTDALAKVMVENIPRIDGLQWYCDRIGLDLKATLSAINAIPKRYAA
jgi:glucosamine--fructose-6-phosphate aminotransferase (isomerizing)